ncbi:2-oxoglutarate dehydrogenase E1 subunit family protein, partial [Mycolicibacterium mucogenicum]|uniref:2-oxoglutarate dehydrogenase E1 subunit family protein n=1 Tax=Mycolicibacterium mucogenicum TaxID=56689 RepID=UPI0013A538F9
MSTSPSPFGQNEWLVEEMYRKFREDPSSVDPSWHDFLRDYNPEPITDTTDSVTAASPAPAAGAAGAAAGAG